MDIFIVKTSGTGCKLRDRDVIRANEILKNLGLVSTENEEEATVVIYFACQFTLQKESTTINEVKDYAAKGKTVLLSGCLQNVILSNVKDPNVTIVPEDQLESFLDKNYEHSNPKTTSRTTCNIVKISDGCYGKCAYCSIPFGRPHNGQFSARPVEQIIREIGEIEKNNVFLAALDVSAYRYEKYRLPDLLAQIWKAFPNKEIQLGNLNITFVKSWTDKDLEVLAQVKGNINLPIQSANDRIIKYMNRFYTVEDFRRLYSKLKNLKASVITDMIVGFPSETIEEHKRNYEFFHEFPMSFTQIFKFDPKKGTPAAEFPYQIPDEEKIKRTIDVMTAYAINNPEGYINTNI